MYSLKMKNKYRVRIVLLLIFSVLFVANVPLSSASASEKLIDKYRDALKLKPIKFTTFSEDQLPIYSKVFNQWLDEGFQDVKEARVNIPAANFTNYESASDTSPEILKGIGDTQKNSLVWKENVKWIEWEFDVKESGMYNIELTYFPLEGNRSSIDRSIKIDGEFPFNEAQRLTFYRMWADKGEPTMNNQGDDVRPKQIEVPHWETVRFIDNEGNYPEPFRFYMEKGKHTLRLDLIKEPIAISNISLVPPEVVPTYEEVKQEYKSEDYKELKDVQLKVQAEKALYKTDPTIRRESNSDPLVEPAAGGNLRLNAIGDWRWRKGGQHITWKFDVPRSGLYNIGLKVGQWWGDGLPTYRKVEIDGKVPFKAMHEYSFDYNNKWRLETLSDENEPYLFYLTEGEHTLRLTAQMGPYREVIQSLLETILQISDLNRKIIMVTGTKPDKNYRYELEKRIPELNDDLQAIMKQLEMQEGLLKAISGASPAIVHSLRMIRDQYEKMMENPDIIPNQLEDITNSQGQLGNWLLSLKEAPLVVDYFLVASTDTKWPDAMSNPFQRAAAMFKNFLSSFYKDYDSVGDTYDKTDGAVLEVWVGNGREWAELLKDLADEDFTPETGIKINVNTIPAGQLAVGGVNTLLLATSSGKAPDVATSVDSLLPVEFAFRDAAVNLNQFEDFPEVAKRFLPGALIPFHYNNGDYALPETQDFNVLIYRKDILQELDLGIPDTWEDLYQMLPILQQNGMEAYIPPILDPFLYQFGGSFYNKGGTETGLSTPEAYTAFKEWTDLFTNFRIPIQADFFNRMRSGEMPIGLAGYQHYVLLSTAAPELTGRWGIAPAPGTKTSDGTVDRTAGGALRGSLIFKQSTHQKESWEFLKWWMDTETQLRFGQELESLLGVEARWNSANIEAFQGLPWPNEDLETFQEQWKWYREQPVVLGGYFTGRHISNAWNRVVLSAENPRESLEEAIKDINKELKAKQEEFGLTPSDQ